MSWLSNLASAGHLGAAVSHFNDALDVLEREGSAADATRCLSDALNEVQAEWSLLKTPAELDDVMTFQAMLAQTLSSDAQTKLLRSDEVANALGLEPGVVTGDDESRARPLECTDSEM